MKRSDKDPARRPKVEPGDAMTDDFAPAPGDDATTAETATERAGGGTRRGRSGNDSSVESQMERMLAEQQDKYLRLAAEYDNYRKRSVRERQEASLRGQAELLRGLLDALDDLSRFAHVDPATTDTKTVVDGVAMVERKMLKTLTGVGLEVINPVDQTFDPSHDGSCRDGAGAVTRGRSRRREGLSAGLPVQRPAAASRARRREAVERLRTY